MAGMNPKAFLFAVYLCGGVLLAAISVPLIRRKVPPNPLYGFRVRRTMADPSVWYPANEYAGRWMLAAAACWVAAATAGYFLPVGFVPYALMCAGVLLAATAVGILQSFRYLRKLPQPG